MPTALDQLDRNIIRLLRQDGRISNLALAGEIGLSQSACLRRVKLLEKAGIIRGYTAIVSATGDDDGMIAIVQITLERQTEDHLDRFEAAVLRHPEIRHCLLMTGRRLPAAGRGWRRGPLRGAAPGSPVALAGRRAHPFQLRDPHRP